MTVRVDAQAQEYELAELRQTIARPSSDMSAGEWCEAANNAVLLAVALAARLEAAETALRTEFFRLLPHLDYESEDGVWAWEQHPWFSLLSVEYDDCVAAIAAGRGEA